MIIIKTYQTPNQKNPCNNLNGLYIFAYMNTTSRSDVPGRMEIVAIAIPK